MGRTDKQRATRRRRGILTGITGIAALVLVALPLWTTTAQADQGVQYGPFVGMAGTSVGFEVTNCQAFAGHVDIVIEINTMTGGDELDRTGYDVAENDTYVYSAPPEFDFAAL